MDKKYNKQYAIEKAEMLAEALIQKGIKINSVYLFGSFINDNNKDYEWSDIDIAIVSDDFTGYRIADNRILIPISVQIEPRIETHPFTSTDFMNSPFAQNEIMKKGLKINL